MSSKTRRRLAAVSTESAFVEAAEYVVKSVDPSWAEARFISDAIGRGVFMLEEKAKNAFILQYHGELLPAEEARAREKDDDRSVYRFFFKSGRKELCIDATVEPTTGPRLARLVNHSTDGNAKPAIVMVGGKPHICLFASKSLSPGDQVLYNYGLKDLPFEDLIAGQHCKVKADIIVPQSLTTVIPAPTGTSLTPEPIVDSVVNALQLEADNNVVQHCNETLNGASLNCASTKLQAHGSFHQASERFSDISRGRQCTFNALVAAVTTVVKKPSTWTSADMDEILKHGDIQYRKLCEDSVPNWTLTQLKYVDCIDSGENQFTIKYYLDADDEALGGLMFTPLDCADLPLHTLSEALHKLFNDDCSSVLMVVAEYTVAILRSDNSFFVFDSHSRDNFGMLSQCGTSSLVNVGTTLAMVEEFLKSLAQSLNLDNAQFEMIGVVPRLLDTNCQLLPMDDVCQPELSATDDASQSEQLVTGDVCQPELIGECCSSQAVYPNSCSSDDQGDDTNIRVYLTRKDAVIANANKVNWQRAADRAKYERNKFQATCASYNAVPSEQTVCPVQEVSPVEAQDVPSDQLSEKSSLGVSEIISVLSPPKKLGQKNEGKQRLVDYSSSSDNFVPLSDEDVQRCSVFCNQNIQQIQPSSSVFDYVSSTASDGVASEVNVRSTGLSQPQSSVFDNVASAVAADPKVKIRPTDFKRSISQKLQSSCNSNANRKMLPPTLNDADHQRAQPSCDDVCDEFEDSSSEAGVIDEDKQLSDNEGNAVSINRSSAVLVSSAGEGKNRKLPCKYCGEILFQMPRHLIRKHANEAEVAAASVSQSKGNKLPLQCLVNEGVYKYNVEVLRQKDGILIVCRAPATKRSVDDFLPCSFCLQFFVKAELYRHCQKCNFRIPGGPVKGFITSGRALLTGSLIDDTNQIDESLRKHVLPRMRHGERSDAAKTDNLILKLGVMLLRKLGYKRALDISARMRELGRLKIRLLAKHSERSLEQYITGSNFDNVMEAIETEGESYSGSNGRRLFKNPSYVLKVGNSLLKCAHLKHGAALRGGDTVALKDCEDFLKLYSNEFTDRLASSAHASARLKGNKLDEFPDEDDLRRLRNYQQSRMLLLQETMADEFEWRELAELTLSRVLIFNGRRGSEASELTLKECEMVTNKVDPTLMAMLSDVEKQLLQKLNVINVIGKRNRPVPILLTPDMIGAMTALRNSREACGVLSANPFVFALPQTNRSHLSFYNTLLRVAEKADLKQPRLLTTTRMRKHLATMAQLIDLTPGELQWLSSHMGHDVVTHKKNYRLHAPAVEITKVGRLLMAIDEGKSFAGKRVNALLEKESSGSDEDVEPDSPEDSLTHRPTEHRNDTRANKQCIAGTSNSTSPPVKVSRRRRIVVDSDCSSERVAKVEGRTSRKRRRTSADIEIDSNVKDQADEESTLSVKRHRAHAPVGRWTEEEKSFLRTRFSNAKTSDREIRKAQQEMPDLKKRTIKQIRTRVWFLLKS